MYEFETPGPITVAARLPSGGVVLTAEERDTTTVEVKVHGRRDAAQDTADGFTVELRGDTLVIEPPDHHGWSLWRRGGSVRVDVRVPLDSALSLKVASADGQVLGRWREGSIESASGDIRVEDVTGDLSAKTASGDLSLGRIEGGLRATTASGDITVLAVGGDTSVQTASGDATINDVGGSVTVRTASGDVELGRLRRGEARVQTVSGDVRIAVIPGTGVFLDVSTVSGSTHSDLAVGDVPTAEKGTDLGIHTRTVSGDVLIARAPATSDPGRQT